MDISKADTSLHYAKPIQRAIAFFFDFLIIAGYILILFGIGISITTLSGKVSLLALPIAMKILAFAVLVLSVILYFAMQESSSQQATWGKQRAKIKVVPIHGKQMSFWRSLLRSAIKFFRGNWHMCVSYTFGTEVNLPFF